MDKNFWNHIHQSLQEKRDNLAAWLALSAPAEKKLALGPTDQQAVEVYIQTIDNAITESKAETLGCCEVCEGHIEPDLLEMDYTCCVCLEHLPASEIRKLELELELAQSVQQTLLPQQVPTLPGLEFAAYSRPAQIVGGDYFDFFGFQDGRQGFTVADVAGHGMSASLHMASVQTLLRTLVPANDSPAEVAAQMQHLYSHNIRFSTFVTLFIGAYDPGVRTLTYCNAGHNPGMVIREAGNRAEDVELLAPTGPAIGLVETAKFDESVITLHPGDVFVLYTDGVTEATNPNDHAFGLAQLKDLVRNTRGLTAKEIVQIIRVGLERFGAGRPLEDDTTVVVCRISKD